MESSTTDRLKQVKSAKVSGMIKKLMEEKKAGIGPHSGPGGPLVTNPKQIQAIAYYKLRRGKG